ncbi:MAG: ABC transporter ATP-binding protein [Actinomycetaceae bacterium]|nr:ABC transporter ATP-binding protein [Actinomycetaceae bacterium]
MGDVLEVVDVSVRRDGHDILDSVSWDVSEGERWIVLGPNGAGKTTVVQLVSGRLHPSSGTVKIIGERLGRVDVNDLRPLVGLTSSAIDARIPPSEKVLDVVRTAAYGHLASWRESYEDMDTERARGLLASLGVGHLADRRFATVSSGERKRIGIARALMPNPEVLILDEPASGLDLGGREALLSTLTQLAGHRGAPVMVLVTHHVEEIPAGFTHALLLKSGRVFASGPLESTVTSRNLSELFDIPLTVDYADGRFAARRA